MSSELNKGISFKTAVDYLEKKKTRKTSYNSKMIAELWNNEARTRAFFSARVAKADLLDAFRHHTEQILTGKSTVAQSRAWIKDFLKSDGNNALSECGFLPVNEQNVLQELGSTRRITLILEQNVRQAQSVGQYRQAQLEKDIIPYMQYKTRDDGKVRSSHQLLHNKIYKADSPVWERIYPPNDYLCRCFIKRLTKRQAEGKSISRVVPKELDEEPLAKSGYSFDVTKGMSEALSDKPKWSDLLKKKYKGDMAPFMRSQVRFLEGQKLKWEQELLKAKTPAYKDLCERTIERLNKSILQFRTYSNTAITRNIKKIITGNKGENTIEDGIKYFKLKESVKTSLGYTAKWHQHLIEESNHKYLHGKGRKNKESAIARLKHIAQSIYALRTANRVYKSISPSGFIQHAYVKPIAGNKFIIVYVGIHSDGYFIRSLIPMSKRRLEKKIRDLEKLKV